MKEENDLPQNLDDSALEKKIYDAQETLRMLMGDEFYQDYLSKYISNQLTGAYSTVYKYVKQYIARQAYEYYTLNANFNPTRSGFRVHTEANSVVATDIQMAMIIKEAKQKAQQYKNLLVDYLNGHSSDFPLYNNKCGNNLRGNTFHISAVKNKTKCTHDHKCRCRSCA